MVKLISAFLISFNLYSGNFGHRLGSDLPLVENSIASIEYAKSFQHLDKFKYWELDICESKNGAVYVFHDATKKKTIKRLCDVVGAHPSLKRALLKQPLYEIDSYYIDIHLRLKNGEHVPGLDVVLDKLVKITRKPIKIEIKKLNSYIAKIETIETIVKYRAKTKQPISLMIKKDKFKRMEESDDLVHLCNKHKIKLEIF